jgi:hypothetical protein
MTDLRANKNDRGKEVSFGGRELQVVASSTPPPISKNQQSQSQH